MRAGGGAFACGRDVRPWRKRRGKRRGQNLRRAGFPLSRVAGSVWVRHASRDDACPRKVRKRFSDKAHAKTLCSEAVSAPEGGRPPPKNALGRAKAKPHKHTTPEATLSRGSPDFELSSHPAARHAGRLAMRGRPMRWHFAKSPVMERRQQSETEYEPHSQHFPQDERD